MWQPNSPTRGATLFQLLNISVQIRQLFCTSTAVVCRSAASERLASLQSVFALNQDDQNMDRVQHLAI